jgi:hypothetical protein
MTVRSSLLPTMPLIALLTACGASPAPAANSGMTSAPGGAADPAFAAANAAPDAKAVESVEGPLGQGLKETSAWFAPGMASDGSGFLATLDDKGRAKAAVMLHAGKCYVIVGFSQDGKIVDFDLRLWKTAQGSAPSLVAEDSDDDTTPTVGKPPICPDADTAYLVELYADKGKGDAAVQLYSTWR